MVEAERAQNFAWRFPQCLDLTNIVLTCLESKQSTSGMEASLASSAQPVALHPRVH